MNPDRAACARTLPDAREAAASSAKREGEGAKCQLPRHRGATRFSLRLAARSSGRCRTRPLLPECPACTSRGSLHSHGRLQSACTLALRAWASSSRTERPLCASGRFCHSRYSPPSPARPSFRRCMTRTWLTMAEVREPAQGLGSRRRSPLRRTRRHFCASDTPSCALTLLSACRGQQWAQSSRCWVAPEHLWARSATS
jgi:hypothetical protein